MPSADTAMKSRLDVSRQSVISSVRRAFTTTQPTRTSMTFSRSTSIACVLCLAAGAGVMWAQQQPGGSRREPQLENDQVSVWKSIVMPKQPLTLHRHEHGRALIALNDGQLNVVDGDGKVLNTYHLKAGT